MSNRSMVALKRIGTAPADAYLDATGNLAMVFDAEAVATHMRCRVMAHEGEWFLDRTAGLPWIRDLLGGQFDPALAEAVIKAEVLDTDGVVEISSFSVKFDRETRGLSGDDIEVYTVYDEVRS